MTATTSFFGCHPWRTIQTSVAMMVLDLRVPHRIFRSIVDTPLAGADELVDLNRMLGQLFTEEATNLVRLARFFVDDRTAAEDLVQEAFIRLSRSAHRVQDQDKIKPYLRSIVLNLARDHNRRGLMSLRHRPPANPEPPGLEDHVAADDDRRVVVAALRQIAPGQRNVLVLRYYMELSVAETAATLGVSVNTVKTQQQRGLASLAQLLEGEHDDN